ncbi:MAG: phytanoyl-CoA dioxygenase family protein [Ilumatobacteraceae bacterium]
MSFLTAQNIDEVRKIGYSVVRDAIDQTHAVDLRVRLAKLVAEQRERATDLTRVDDYMVHNPIVLDSAFLDLLEHPAIIEVLDEFLGDTSILYACTTSSMPAGGTNYSNRIHVDSPRVIPGYVAQIGVIIALDDFTEENGATYMLPSSFERILPPTDEEFFANAERVLPRRGDLVVLQPRTWHLGGMNNTTQDRHAVTLSACRSFMRQRFDYPRLIDPSLAETLSPTLRRLLGFNVRVPANLDEYYVPQDQRLYKAGQG